MPKFNRFKRFANSADKPWLEKKGIVVLVVVYAAVVRAGAVPPRPNRVVGHGELLHGVGVDRRRLVHHDAARGLVKGCIILAGGQLG